MEAGSMSRRLHEIMRDMAKALEMLVPCSPSLRDAAVLGWGSTTSRLVGKDKDDSCWNVPEELKCLISLDLKRNPVIVESGHTYDCTSISEWLDSGQSTYLLNG
ncbi:hypothetical protein SUGI_0074920 [Cryptomeria japonica]|nr:hypothetical protein SUGI_0074920 [Cryptomeria japonica]